MRPLPYAYGQPLNSASFKLAPDDFIVDEALSFPLSGEGEHCFVRIEKVERNTEEVARTLAEIAGVPLLAVGYAGLKDRQARARQWFSIALAGRSMPDWSSVDTPALRVIESARHRRKLKRGDLLENQFQLTLRDLGGPTPILEDKLARIARDGVPNYYGPQRFGHGGANLQAAANMLSGTVEVRSRHHRSLYLSAARSYLFNQILATRVEQACWNSALQGDVFMVGRDDRPTNRLPAATDLAESLASLTAHPAGTLWGRGRALPSGEALAVEQQALANCSELCAGLERFGLQRSARALRIAVGALQWELVDPRTVRVAFTLPAGAYATSVLRELIQNPELDLAVGLPLARPR